MRYETKTIMPLRTISISEADADDAKYEMIHHPDALVQQRMLCLRMKYSGHKNKDIAKVLGVSRNTIGNYLTLYLLSGLEGLKTLNYNQPQSALDKHELRVETSFRQHAPRSVREAAVRIKKLTGIKRSNGRVRAFLKRLGMSPRQTGQIPAKADRQKQREFHDRVLQPLLKQCLQKDCHVLFMDSAHFVLAAFVSMVWCFERVFIKGASGRFRLNVIGVVHAATKEFTGFFNTSYINADSVVQLLQRIAIDYAGMPIYIVLDNARYQHCKLVMETAKQLQINLVFLPPYSPNLNLIERLWKFVKAEVCSSNYYPDAKSFQNAIIGFLNQLHRNDLRKQLKSRLTLNFQLFDNAQNLAA